MKRFPPIAIIILFCCPLAIAANQALSKEAATAIVTDFLKENVNDSSKLEIVKVTGPIATSDAYYWDGGNNEEHLEAKPLGWIAPGFWVPVNAKCMALLVKYRSSNTVGAMVLQVRVFCIDQQRNVIRSVPLDDFSIHKPQQKQDPISEEFFKSSK
jgi:hypothetical protein